MNAHWNDCSCPRPSQITRPGPLTRRELLWRGGAGFAGVALAGLLGSEALAGPAAENPLAPKTPHFSRGAPSACGIFSLYARRPLAGSIRSDYKPLLDRDDGKPLPFDKPRVQFAQTGNLLRSAIQVHPARTERANRSARSFRAWRNSRTTCASSIRCTVPIRRTAARS